MAGILDGKVALITGAGWGVCEEWDSRQRDLPWIGQDRPGRTTPRQPGRSEFGIAAGAGAEGAIGALSVSVGEPEDIARIALFLASNEARMITGAIIPADGGLSAY
jgi:NAD(P)-dependent dehydrogenase (short-subunit alcohol dehydrogenase family)